MLTADDDGIILRTALICCERERRLLDDLIECLKINGVREIQGEVMEKHLSHEIKDYILRLHWAGYQFSAIAFKVNNAYGLSVTREMVNLVISENLSRRASAKTWDSPVSS